MITIVCTIISLQIAAIKACSLNVQRDIIKLENFIQEVTMIKWRTPLICLLLGMVSLQAVAKDMYFSYAAQEVVIPGYSPPAPQTSSDNPQSPAAIIIPPEINSSNTSAASNPNNTPGIINAEQGHKSCDRYIPIPMQIEVIQGNLKKLKFDDEETANIYRWKRDGESDLMITFIDNTPIDVKGNLPSTLGNATDLRFSLPDVQKLLSNGEIMGHVYIYSKGDGKLKVYTDVNNKTTSFTSSLLCE